MYGVQRGSYTPRRTMKDSRGTIETNHGLLRFGGRTLVMGILNVTPDSFSDGGDYASADAAVYRGLQMQGEGADVIDVGGESTRPGSDPVSPDEQIQRVVPVIERLRRGGLTVPISIDTRGAAVADAALEAGADFVNDVSALRDDPALSSLIARRGAAVALMHRRGPSKAMQDDPRYDDVVADILAFLAERIDAAVRSDIDRERILIDPGIGFGKTTAHNLEILRRLAELHALGRPIVAGPSRKQFLGEILGEPDPRRRRFGTAAAIAACCHARAGMVRVHDVHEMRQVVDLCHAIWPDG